MRHFEYRDGRLLCEEVPIELIAEDVGTPFYLYSHAALTEQFRAFDRAFAGVPHVVCFAVKANSNLAILKLLGDLGGGADVVSGGELYRALRAGIRSDRIVFAGVGKTRDEMEYALKSDILMFNVESSDELRLLDEVAGRMGAVARVALRINPDVDPKTHPYIATGLKHSKFGIDICQAMEEYRLAKTLPHIRVVGIHQHIGSQITELAPFVDGLTKIAELIVQLRSQGFTIEYLDVGGGLGIAYKDENPPLPRVFAGALLAIVKDLDCTLVLEPGRFIVGNAGALVTTVLYDKATPAKRFIVVDAGMNDLIRPSLYGSYHSILPVRRRDGAQVVVADVVGPVCESGDFLAKDRALPLPAPGDLLAVMSAGAYGHAMSSNYNSRPRPPEIIVRRDRYFTIRERESYEDLIRGERLYPDLL
jgi:diaminopimelate decarboxylase